MICSAQQNDSFAQAPSVIKEVSALFRIVPVRGRCILWFVERNELLYWCISSEWLQMGKDNLQGWQGEKKQRKIEGLVWVKVERNCQYLSIYLSIYLSLDFQYLFIYLWRLYSVVFNCDIVVDEFDFHLRYYVHFWRNLIHSGIVCDSRIHAQLWVK